jgi:hypothetical protein
MIRRNKAPLPGMTEAATIWRIDPDSPLYHKLRVGSENELGNRQPVANNVAAIQKSYGTFFGLKYKPILLDSKLNVIDGQNRYEACRTNDTPLPLYVQFLNDDIDPKELMILFNTGPVYKWKLQDYINFHAQFDNMYLNFKECMAEYAEIKPTVMVSIFLGSTDRERSERMSGFKEGNLKQLMEQRGMTLARVYHVLSQVYRLRGAPTNPILTKKTFSLGAFQFAALRIIDDPEFDFDAFLERVRDVSHMLNRFTDADELTQELYDIAYRREA